MPKLHALVAAALLLMLVLVSQLNAQDRPALVGTWRVTSWDLEFRTLVSTHPVRLVLTHMDMASSRRKAA
jgi:hypothetical protein